MQNEKKQKPLGERVDATMKVIDEALVGANFNNNFINDVAKKYERQGYEVARVYVRGKYADRLRRDERESLPQLLQIIDAIHANNLPGPVASFIIKKLNGIKISKEVGDGRASQKPRR